MSLFHDLSNEQKDGRIIQLEKELAELEHLQASQDSKSAELEEFTEEHQKSLDWLNDHTTDDLAFYGVVLELMQIDESRPAVRFNVVSRPAELVRQAAIAKASGSLTDAKKLQLEYWTEFRRRLLASKAVPSAQAARPQYWYDIALGKSGIHLSAIASTYNDQVGIKVYIHSTLADAALPQLEAQRDEIEAEVGEKLQWNPNPENRDKIIALYRKASLLGRTRTHRLTLGDPEGRNIDAVDFQPGE